MAWLISHRDCAVAIHCNINQCVAAGREMTGSVCNQSVMKMYNQSDISNVLANLLSV
jgi:hypothetical protein